MAALKTSIVQIIFSFWFFEISDGILKNQKIIISLVSDDFLINFKYIWPHLDYPSLSIDYPVKDAKLQSFSLASCCQIYRVTEDA